MTETRHPLAHNRPALCLFLASDWRKPPGNDVKFKHYGAAKCRGEMVPPA